MVSRVTIDGRQLSYPGTGLSLVTAELLHAFEKLEYTDLISVFVEKSFDPGTYGLENVKTQWIQVDIKNYSPDYIGRLAWAKLIGEKLKRFGNSSTHFIPYLYNYGNISQNVVLIPDLVYKIFPDYGTKGPNVPWWSLRGRLPVRPIFRRWEEQQVIRAERLVVYSEFVKCHINQELGVNLERLTVAPLATPSWVTTQYDEVNNTLIREPFNLPTRFVLYVGGFALRKNIAMLLRACGSIYNVDSSFRCVFVGLTESVISHNPEIHEAMMDISIQSSVVTLPHLKYKDLASLYHLAEFTVYPSISEGFGLPILEAAVAEKLCLCGDNSSMREIQTDSQYRINSKDTEAWIQKILYFWQNPVIAIEAGKTSKKICNRYSWEKSAQQIWQLIQS